MFRTAALRTGGVAIARPDHNRPAFQAPFYIGRDQPAREGVGSRIGHRIGMKADKTAIAGRAEERPRNVHRVRRKSGLITAMARGYEHAVDFDENLYGIDRDHERPVLPPERALTRRGGTAPYQPTSGGC